MYNTLGLVSESQPIGAMLPIKFTEPRKPRPPKNVSDLETFLKNLANKAINYDPTAKRQRDHQMFLSQEFWQSRQYGFFEGDSWLNPDVNRDGIYYQCDYFSEQVSSLLSQWVNTKLEFIVTANEDSSRGLLAAKAGSDILGSTLRKVDTPLLDQIVGLSAILKGTYFLHQYYNANSKAHGTAQIPVLQQEEVPNPDQMFQCLNPKCGHADKLSLYQSISIDPTALGQGGDDLGAPDPMAGPSECPQCQSPIEMIGPSMMTKVSVSHYEEYALGEIMSANIPAEEVQIHPSARGGQVDESPWLVYETRVAKSVVEDLYWYVEGFTGTTPKKSQRYIRTLERQVGSFTGSTTGGNYGGGGMYQEDLVTLTRIWFDVSAYKPYVFDKPHTFENGMEIPAGTPLADAFPNGIYMVMYEGRILDIRDEDKNDYWVGGVYKVVPGAAYGLGVHSALWQQRLLNDIYNLSVECLRHLAVPQRLYNASVFDGGMVSGNARNLIPIENIGPDGDLSKLMYQVPASGQNNSIPQFIQQARNDMMSGTQTNSALLGQSTPGATAADSNNAKEQALARAGLPMQLKAQAYEKRAEQFLKLFKKHCMLARALPVYSDHSKIQMRTFAAADIDTELFVTFAEHTAVPRTAADRRKDILDARDAGVYDPSTDPKLRKMLGDVFQTPYTGDEPGVQAAKAEDRYGQIEALVKKFRRYLQFAPQQAQLLLMPAPDDPTQTPMFVKNVLTEVPIDLEYDDHDAQQMWNIEWGSSDRGYGRDVDPLLKMVMKYRLHEHRDAALQLKQSQSADATLSNAPQMAAAQQAGQELGGAALPVKTHLDPKGTLAPQ